MGNTKEVIDRFCDIILTEKDYIDMQLADNFIDSLENEIADLNIIKEPEKNREIRSIILDNVMSYIRRYHEASVNGVLIAPPFSFDNGSVYADYRDYFTKKYQEKNKNSSLPSIFEFAFDYIQDVSEHYRIFLGFYDTRSEETIESVLSKTNLYAEKLVYQTTNDIVEKIVKQTIDEVVKAATDDARKSAKEAAEQAQKASNDAEMASNNAKTAVEIAVKEKMIEVTQHVSETSVTILGIFSGIVLTVVAGLFYSSSVLENIMTPNIERLLCVSALVGLVCFNLIILMFRYIERIRNGSEQSSTYINKLTMFVNVILIVVMIISGIIEFSSSDSTKVEDDIVFSTEAEDN